MMFDQLNIASAARPDEVSEQGPDAVLATRQLGRTLAATTDETSLAFEDKAPHGSMALGRKRSDDQPLAIEPEKHLTPRATSKEFFFPKSN